MNKTRTFIGLFLLLSLNLLIACSKEEPPAQEILRPVRYQLVTKGSDQKIRSFSGVSVAATETKLSFRVGGSLQKLQVKAGQMVQRGDLIAALDDRDLQLKYEETKAAVLNSQVQENNAQANLARIRELYENNNVALSEYEQAKNSYASAKADYAARLKQLDLAKSQQQYSQLFSPMTGVVTEVPVAKNENINTGEVIAVISSSKDIEIRVGVPEAYISAIQSGAAVSVQFSSLTEQKYPGVVTEVSYVAADYSTFPVTIRLDQPDARLRPGMAAEVNFTFAGGASDTLKVSSSAVAEDQAGNYVYLLGTTDQDNVAIIERRAVVVGELTQQGFVIRDGLQEGDAVVISGVSKISAGMKVRFDKASPAK